MSRSLATVVGFAWALWFGGMVFLFAALGAIFTTPGFERDVQGAFAQRLFPAFERMQLAFAAAGLLGTAAWWVARRARVKLVLFALLGAATVIAFVETTVVTPRVQRLVSAGQRGTPEFDRAHELSTRVYTAGAVALLLAGLALPAAIRADATPAGTTVTPEPPRTS
jgi:di/tricarboxylate transporter